MSSLASPPWRDTVQQILLSPHLKMPALTSTELGFWLQPKQSRTNRISLGTKFSSVPEITRAQVNPYYPWLKAASGRRWRLPSPIRIALNHQHFSQRNWLPGYSCYLYDRGTFNVNKGLTTVRCSRNTMFNWPECLAHDLMCLGASLRSV